ncbi:hypothetical protein DFQ28_002038 [Apophysomyces sp. BC1034]|nr:hypothetical protein DFQ28_002038 [Apophysomyces sp. BC1034]
MGLFSFGSKDDAGPSRATEGGRTGRTRRGERRAERRTDPDAMLLDPTLPEKQRARRRLVGAIALVIAAVIVLPMVLDSPPKPVTGDIEINLPARPAPVSTSSHRHDDGATMTAAPDNPPPAAASADKSAMARSTPTVPAGNRYVVQLGALDNDAAARDWVSRLKALGVPAYVERRRQPDGSERVLLRAGPFADRSAAAAAVSKVREAGLTAGAGGKRTQ